MRQLGKNESDLPVIAIDNFTHKYLFPNFQDIEVPGKLKEFVHNFYSGKLRREFWYGPDPNTTPLPAEWKTSKQKSITNGASVQSICMCVFCIIIQSILYQFM